MFCQGHQKWFCVPLTGHLGHGTPHKRQRSGHSGIRAQFATKECAVYFGKRFQFDRNLHAVRNYDTFRSFTYIKCFISNAYNTIRYSEIRNLISISKHSFFNFCYACRYDNTTSQALTTVECIFSNARNSTWK